VTQTPELKSFGDLSQGDFVRHPVWINCHVADYDEPWYDDTDEETFRPFAGRLPVGPGDGMFLVAAVVTLADGTRLSGFLTPASDAGGIGELQPEVFVGDGMFGFWGGMLGVAETYRNALYDALGKGEAKVFPLQVAALPDLATGVTEAVVPGWMSSSD
jgi:hypothetical protein